MDSHLINSVVLWIDGSIIFATKVAANKVTKFNLKNNNYQLPVYSENKTRKTMAQNELTVQYSELIFQVYPLKDCSNRLSHTVQVVS